MNPHQDLQDSHPESHPGAGPNLTPGPLGIIPVHVAKRDDVELLRTTVRTFRETAGNTELLLVDDGSPDERLARKVERLAAKHDAELVRKENSGFSRTVNVGLRRARDQGRDAVLINADMEFRDEGWLSRMVATEGIQTDTASVVGAHLIYPMGVVQHSGIYFSLLTRTFHHIGCGADPATPELLRPRSCPVTGALMLIRPRTLAEVGLFDEEFRMGFEDVDYCLRVLQSGGECVLNPKVWATHHESAFRGRRSPKLDAWHHASAAHLAHKWRDVSFAHLCPPL